MHFPSVMSTMRAEVIYMEICRQGTRLIIRRHPMTIWLDPWGPNGIRVRASCEKKMDEHDWALTEPVEETESSIVFREVDMTDPWNKASEDSGKHSTGTEADLINGKIRASVSPEGWISFFDDKGNILTQEYWRTRDHLNRYTVPLRVEGREMKSIPGTDAWQLTARFEAYDDEQIFGMGQYQDAQLDKKGCILELAHRNSQASVPFYVSSRGYGFLWNNPAVGQVVFGNNRTEWSAKSTRKLDYYITCGDTPGEILYAYTAVTGRTPMMPEYGMGYWQCKLRYRTQDEVLKVAREHKRRGLPMDVIVVDFFHWTRQGDYRFDPRCFPDPKAMVDELRSMGIRTVVSVWPTVDEKSENYGVMREKGYLIRAERGPDNTTTWMGASCFYDATNPDAQRFVWEKCRENYGSLGIENYWLDEAEPEYGPYDFDNYRYDAGPALQVTNVYPVGYARGFYEGQKADGKEDILSLIRCAWAGSQKYAALTWSGDVHSSFRSMREQLQAGLSMGMAGIPWWTCDLGGFLCGVGDDPHFRELLVRWFAWGAFLPVFRMHGERQPWYDREIAYIDGVEQLTSGQDNEVWSFGEEAYQIMTQYLFMRERMRDYIRSVMDEAHRTGAPVMRPLFFEFPHDRKSWHAADVYLFGSKLLVAPVMEENVRERRVYLPSGAQWTDAYTGVTYTGGEEVTVPAPLDVIPVFFRDDFRLPLYK